MYIVIGAWFIALKTSTATGVARRYRTWHGGRNRCNEAWISPMPKNQRALYGASALPHVRLDNLGDGKLPLFVVGAILVAGRRPFRRFCAIEDCKRTALQWLVASHAAAAVTLGNNCRACWACQRSFRSSGVKAMASGPMSNRFAPAATVPASQALDTLRPCDLDTSRRIML